MAAKPQKGRSFFYIPALNWTLKPTYFNLCLKQLALLYNLDPTRISSHSLIIVGASALLAAGVPDYLIMEMGRWRSLTFLTSYVRRSAQMLFDVTRNALARRYLLMANQIKLMAITSDQTVTSHIAYIIWENFQTYYKKGGRKAITFLYRIKSRIK